MLIALFADIHANREAFTACLADAKAAGADSFVLLGDFVGYGPDPEWVVECVAGLVDQGALAIKGNHDAAILDERIRMNPDARAAIEWTRGRLDRHHQDFLSDLPLDLNDDDRLYVHANACEPQDWTYTIGPREAFDSFRYTAQRITFCGHTHRPALFVETSSSLPRRHTPAPGQDIPLLPHRRWLAVIGAVGQPRDNDPAACYGLYDVKARRLRYERVPYDVDVTARKIAANGLPPDLAARLLIGC